MQALSRLLGRPKQMLLIVSIALLGAVSTAHAVSTAPTTAATHPGDGFAGALNAMLVGIALLIVVAPVAELWLFALGTGTTIDRWVTTSGTNISSGTSSFGLLAVALWSGGFSGPVMRRFRRFRFHRLNAGPGE